MPVCLSCRKDRSPADARFCVDCGYALRQACPYPSCACADVLLGQLDAPSPRCRECGRFFSFCANCHRLHRLGEKTCRTSRCHNAPLSEPFAPANGSIGDESRRACIALPVAWHKERATFFNGHVTLEPIIGGLAFRYGLLCAVSGRTFTAIFANRRRTAPLDDQTGWRLELDAPLLSNRHLLPHPHALRLAHGMAYLLTEGGPLRVDLASRIKQSFTENTWHQADNDNWANEGLFDDESEVAPEPTSTLADVRWFSQAVTPQRWLGLGAGPKGELCVVECAQDSTGFEAGRLPSPPDSRANEVVDVLPLPDALLVLAGSTLWRLREKEWDCLWTANDDFSATGLLQYGDGFLLWGRASTGIVLHRMNAAGEAQAGSPMTLKAGEVYERPVLINEWLYFFDHTPGEHEIVAVNPAQPLLAPQRAPFVGDSRVVWAMGTHYKNQGWLAYALDDGTDVVLHVAPVSPKPETAWLATSRLRLARSGGAAFAATVADGRLAVAAVTAESAVLRLIDLESD